MHSVPQLLSKRQSNVSLWKHISYDEYWHTKKTSLKWGKKLLEDMFEKCFCLKRMLGIFLGSVGSHYIHIFSTSTSAGHYWLSCFCLSFFFVITLSLNFFSHFFQLRKLSVDLRQDVPHKSWPQLRYKK